MAHLKGQNVTLLLKIGTKAMAAVAASTSCDFNITANTADASAKDDAGGGEWDNQEFQNYSWNCSNESFLVDAAYLKTLLNHVINGTAIVGVCFEHKTALGSNVFKKKGDAIITSLEVTAANGDFVKINISLEGCSALTASTAITTYGTNTAAKIKGKTMMVAVKSGSSYYTLACSTSHKLSVSIQTGDVTDKDMNDAFVAKEVTGRSITLSTENLIDAANSSVSGKGLNDIYTAITGGNALTLAFGYYPTAIGASKHGDDGNANGWSTPGTVMVEGSFLCTSLNQNAQNKNDFTWSAEFAGKGKPTVTMLTIDENIADFPIRQPEEGESLTN